MLAELLRERLDSLLVPVVGNYYRSTIAQKIYKNLGIGCKVLLVFDPRNKFDKNAIKVLSIPEEDGGKSHHLGFVDRTYSSKIVKIVKDCFDEVYQRHGFSYKFSLIDVEFNFTVFTITTSYGMTNLGIIFTHAVVF
jgi:hypothetical protein